MIRTISRVRGWMGVFVLVLAVPIAFSCSLDAQEKTTPQTAWQAGDHDLADAKHASARDHFLEALALHGREGRRPGFLLFRLAQAQEGLGQREAAWDLYQESLTRPWGGPAGDENHRAEARRKLLELVPESVAAKPHARALAAYQEQLESWMRFKDPLVRLVVAERLAWFDPGHEGFRQATASNLGQWLKEELEWQLGRPSRIPIRSALKDWTWRNREPEVVGGNRILMQARPGESALLLVPTETSGGFSFTVDLRRHKDGNPRSWGFVFGDHPDGESRDVVSVHRGILTWSRYQTGSDWRVIGASGVEGERPSAEQQILGEAWQEFTLHLEPLANRIRIFVGDRVLFDMPGKQHVPDGRLGVFVESGSLEVRKASLALAASVE